MSSFWGIVFYIRNIFLLGLTTKKHYSGNQTLVPSEWSSLFFVVEIIFGKSKELSGV